MAAKLKEDIIPIEQALLGICLRTLEEPDSRFNIYAACRGKVNHSDFSVQQHCELWHLFEACSQNGSLSLPNVLLKLGSTSISQEYLIGLLDLRGTFWQDYVKKIQEASDERKILLAARSGSADEVVRVIETSKIRKRKKDSDKGIFDLLPFPVVSFPPSIAKFCEEIAASIPCPIEYPGLAALVVMSVLVQQSNIRIKSSWMEFPNLYAAIIAPSGAGKSPAQDMAMEFLYQIENGYSQEYDIAMEEYGKEMARHEGIREEYKAARKKGLTGDPPPEPMKPARKEIVTTDATTEALAEIMAKNQNGILLEKDELSAWIKALDQYKDGGKGQDREFFLSVFSVKLLKVSRKGKNPIVNAKPRLSVLGGIVPDNLPILMGKRQDGFFERIIGVFPEPMPRKLTNNEVSQYTKAMAFDVLSRMRKTISIEMDMQAKSMFDVFYESQAMDLESPEKPKLIAICARIALILTLAWGKDVCDQEVMGKAIDLCFCLSSHQAKIKNFAGASEEAHETDAIIAWAKRKGLHSVTTREICRHKVGGCTTAKQAKERMQALVDMDCAKWIEQGKSIEIL